MICSEKLPALDRTSRASKSHVFQGKAVSSSRGQSLQRDLQPELVLQFCKVVEVTEAS